jgi:hypothetical protein
MASIVPEYLRKPELVYEVRSRGETPGVDVRTLRGQFRQVAGTPQTWHESLVLSEELDACRERIEELTGEIDSWSTLPIGSAKVSALTQLAHWQNRLKLLAANPDIKDDDKIWVEARIPELQDVVESIRAGRSVKETVKMFEETGSDSQQVTPSLENLKGPTEKTEAGAVASGASSQEQPSPSPLLRLPPVALGLPSCVAVSESRPAGQVIAQTNSSASFSHSFARLPHPLASVLSCFRPVDGLDVETLLCFLDNVLRMREFPGMSDATLMELIAPYCLKPLGDRLLECLRRGVSFDGFHKEVLELFVPRRVMEKLKVEKVFRPQHINEALSQYVGDIRTVERVLRLGIGELELIDIVLQGLKPEERSRLMFSPRPTSFADLDRLSILSRSVQDADFQRSQAAGHLPCTGPHPVVAPVGQAPEQPQWQRQPIVCFGCGQPGHIRRYCRQRENLGRGSKN